MWIKARDHAAHSMANMTWISLRFVNRAFDAERGLRLSPAHIAYPEHPMPIRVFEAELRQSVDYLSTQEVTAMCQLSEAEIMELIEYGVLRSEMEMGEVLFFSMPQVHRLQNASQHRRDFDLDLF